MLAELKLLQIEKPQTQYNVFAQETCMQDFRDVPLNLRDKYSQMNL